MSRQYVRRKPCKHCGKPVKENTRQYCSPECYTESGRRIEVGKINGKKSYSKYWQMFFKIFIRKYGHLTPEEQMMLLINIGQRKTYRAEYKKKLAIIGLKKVG